MTVAACEFLGPFLFGTVVAQTIGKGIIDFATFEVKLRELSIGLLIGVLVGAIAWNLIIWAWDLRSSSSHASIGGMIGAVMVAYGPEKILWKGLLYVVASLIFSPILGLFFGMLFLKATLRLSQCPTHKITFFSNRFPIACTIALFLSHGANDARKSVGLITMSLVIFGYEA